jgi:hypothetical protein
LPEKIAKENNAKKGIVNLFIPLPSGVPFGLGIFILH